MAKIVLKQQDEYGKNSAKGSVVVWHEYWKRSSRSIARIALKEQKEYGRNSAKGAVGVLQEQC